jgi:hypothetical protein
MGIDGADPGHRLEGKCRLGHRAGDRADAGDAEEGLLEAGPIGDRAEGRLHPDEAGMGRRTTARPARIRADCERHHAAGNRRHGAARRATGGHREVPRIACRPVQQIGRLSLGGEFRRVGDADHDGARSLQPRNCFGVLRRNEIPEQVGPLRDGAARHPDVVLDGDRDAGQRQQLAGSDTRIDCGRPCCGIRRIDRGEGVDLAIQRRDARERALRLMPGSCPPRIHGRGDLGHGRPECEGLGHVDRHGEPPRGNEGSVSRARAGRASGWRPRATGLSLGTAVAGAGE